MLTEAVGAVGVPVNGGLAFLANEASTNAVVATCVVLVPALAVVAINACEALPPVFALELTAVLTARNSVLKSPPLITLSGSVSPKASLPPLFCPNSYIL